MSDDAAGNPFRRGLRRTRRAPPCVLVIFGASGDLTRRKLLPALYSLCHDDLLDEHTAVIGVARRDIADGEFRDRMREGIEGHARAERDPAVLERLLASVSYHRASFGESDRYDALRERLDALDTAWGERATRIFYLATPPSAFETVARELGRAGLTEGADLGRTRLVVEKPVGRDLESARALNTSLREVFPERALFRIDHYLGKETVQNLLVFRFANGMFEPLWNNKYVDHVQLTVAESLGVEGRGGYFEEAGIVRDMVQNHVFQILALTAMEPPVAFEPDAVRDEKVKVLRALRPVDPATVGSECVRGQYTVGAPGGREIPGYLDDPGVPDDSRVETFVAMRLRIDNWRWAGVPFYLRVGKALPKKVSEVAIHFRAAPHRLFGGGDGAATDPGSQNVLAIRIQPDEGMSLSFQTKVPGPEMLAHPVSMEFRYASSFGATPADAYERLVLDALLGDGTLFTRDDEVEASWRYITGLRDAWDGSPVAVPEPYAAGTWGPDGADRLVVADGRRWRRP